MTHHDEKTDPSEPVRETDGHTAAAFQVAPHKPPKAHETGTFPDAVVINATEPMPPPTPTPAPRPVERTVEAQTIVNPPRPRPRRESAQLKTMPGKRQVRSRQTAVIIGFSIGIVGTIIAAIIAFGGRSTPEPITDPVAAPLPVPVPVPVPVETAQPHAGPAANPVQPRSPAVVATAAPVLSTKPTDRRAAVGAAAALPSSAASAASVPMPRAPAPTAKPGHFVEPDRSF